MRVRFVAQKEDDMFFINAQSSKTAFQKLTRSTYFVDKTGLISSLVPFIGTEQTYFCITRPRRFGKTINARTLACFLSRGLEAQSLFDGLDVAKNEQAMQHLGAHDVIYIDFSALPMPCEGYRD